MKGTSVWRRAALAGVLGLLLATLVGPAGTSYAEGKKVILGDLKRDAVGLNGRFFQIAQLGGGSGQAILAPKRPFRRQRLVPACRGNSAMVGMDAGCGTAVASCQQRGVTDAFLVWIYLGPEGVADPAANQWSLTGQRCMRRRDVRAAPVRAPALTLEQFRRLPLPPGGLHIQP